MRAVKTIALIARPKKEEAVALARELIAAFPERRFLVELVRRQPRRLRWEAAEALARMCDRARLPGSVA